MSSTRYALGAALAAFLMSCAGQADHFYALTTLPESMRAPGTAYTTHVILNVSIPTLVDRRQMVVSTSGDQVLVLEHERWAAPMSELLAQTLARDLEQRRADVLVGDRGFDQSGVPSIKIKVDVVQLTVRRGGRATLEAHWRIVDPCGKSRRGRRRDFLRTARQRQLCGGRPGLQRRFELTLADRLAANLPVH
jgi:uncharacterized lipoprotein YmbA